MEDHSSKVHPQGVELTAQPTPAGPSHDLTREKVDKTKSKTNHSHSSFITRLFFTYLGQTISLIRGKKGSIEVTDVEDVNFNPDDKEDISLQQS